MTNREHVAQAAEAFQEATEALAGVLPNGFHQRSGAALLAVTGSLIPALNVIMSVADTPDTADIGLLCAKAGPHVQELPWSIRVRGDAGTELVGLAGSHGLTTLTHQPFMLLPLEDEREVWSSGTEPSTVRPLRDDEHEIFATVLGTAFGAPAFVITSLYTPHVLGQPFVRAYVAEVDGVAAAAGLAILTERHVGLANIGTLPEYRGRGLGRAVTEAILRDGRAAGARTAYLHSGDESVPLFERAGFRTEESWTLLTA
ncbi:GNAT family N-acetyltransferase [Streptomyces sp. NPDC060184]|uniref:GNAT family N-acetyltransferase n=1 Tax=Streptomyces sp. NPDC060184 TaxID=3347064 RepID=UPI00365A2498